jgi:hypothetical protein
MRDLLARDIMDLMRDYLNDDPDAGFEENYVGVVENNKDPERTGRCQIRIHGLHDGISTENLQWMEPEFPLSMGLHGSFIVPEIGTTVNIFYVNGDVYQPKYTSKAVDKTTNNFSADKNEDYPDTCILYETKKGDYLKINRAKGEFTLQTAAGCTLKMSQNGDIDIDNSMSNNGDMTLNLRGDFKIDNRLGNTTLITQDCNLSAFGSITVKSNESFSLDTLGEQTYRTNSDFEVVAGKRVMLKSKDGIRTESKKQDIRANDITINPSEAGDFSLAVASDSLQVLAMSVEADPMGGPFNCLMFDPLTGAPHQGRKVTGMSIASADLTDRTAEITAKTAQIVSKYEAMKLATTQAIIKKYASLDMQVQLLASSIGSTVLTDDKAKETTEQLAQLSLREAEELKKLNDDYVAFLTVSVLSKEKAEYETYKAYLESAVVTLQVAEDITGKTVNKDIAGAGKGLVNDD